MCAHLVDRWSREEILHVFLDKSSPGWSEQECFLSPFKHLYGPTVRIVQGLEHQNLQANSGMPKFISLLHLQPPFSYYCWQTTQRGLYSGFLLSAARSNPFRAAPGSELKVQVSYAVCQEKQPAV